jgi:O-antigen/teichoic acid export membrane protein
MAVRLLSVPGQVVSGNFGDTIQRELASRAQRSGDAAQRLLRFWALRLLALGVAVIAPIAAVCSAFAGLLLGAEWAGMGPIVPWLALHWICAFAIAPVSRVVLVADGQRQKLVYDVLAATLPLGLFFLLAASGLANAVAAYSLGHVFCYGVYWLLIDRCSRSLDRVGA